MRRILFGAVIVSALLSAASLGTASAADLGVKAPSAPAPWVCPWCSVYVGVNAGYGTTSGSGINNTGTDTGTGGLGNAIAAGLIPITVDTNASGFLGGGQIGFNWEPIRDWIVGVEADFDDMSRKTTKTPTPSVGQGGANAAATLSTSFDREVDWVSTFRLKGGFSVMNNALFVYGTAGGAVAQFGISNQFICPNCVPSGTSEPGASASNKITRVGGAVGAGLEWMVIPKVSVKAELLYIEVGSSTSTITYNYTLAGAQTSTLTSTARDGLTIFRGGLNWYF